MDKLIELLKGKKSYFIAGIILVLGILQGFEIWVVPESVWPILAAAGLASIRAGVNSVSETIKPKQ